MSTERPPADDPKSDVERPAEASPDGEATTPEAEKAGSTKPVLGLGMSVALGGARPDPNAGKGARDAGIQRPPFMDPPKVPGSGAKPDLPAAEMPVTTPPTSSPPVSTPPQTSTPDADASDGDATEQTVAPVSADEATRPPNTALRYPTPMDLYTNFPEVKSLTMHRPREDESVRDYMIRLRGSTTPEETVTFTAFAAHPAMAVWWGYSCLRTMADTLSPEDRGLMEMIAMWSGNPDNTNRWRVMKSALYAPKLTPVGYLGLAVGWSGGSVAPNDPAPVPAWRTPRAINTAVLSSVAHISLQERSRSLARFINLAGKMFDVY